MKKWLKYGAWAVAVLASLALIAYAWAYQVASGRYEKQWIVHQDGFQIPFPPRDDAIRRGRHLVESRTGCNACHGADFGGGIVIDSVMVARWVAPNLTTGEGSVVRHFTANDWDRAVRHGVRRNGRTSSMPVTDYSNLTDHELSDIVTYIQSVPPVSRDLGHVKLGPAFLFAIATEPKTLGAFTIDHDKPHAVEPPVESPSAELGQHIVQVCTGCHGPRLSGGKLAGDPNMPLVANLTPHETGLKSWSEADFFRAIRTGQRPDGTAISEMMPWRGYAQMTDTELKAVWVYLQTLPPLAKGNH